MPIPMPTVVSKGMIAIRLERRYSTPERRVKSLMYLRDAYAALTGTPSQYGTGGVSGTDVARNLSKALSGPLAQVLEERWFGPSVGTLGTANPTTYWADFSTNPSTGALNSPGNFWWTLGYTSPAGDPLAASTFTVSTLTPAQVADAQKIIVKGLIRALEVSLGLDPDPRNDPGAYGQLKPVRTLAGQVQDEEGTPAAANRRMVDASSLTRNLPVEVFWVCGKFDGFEVQISWDAHCVSVFIVTPPVRMPVGGLTPVPAPTLAAAMQGSARGMIVVNAANTLAVAGGPSQVAGGDLLAIADGGLTPP